MFTTQIPSEGTYDVTASTQPSGLSCTVKNGNGTVTNFNINTVQVTCAPSTSLNVWTWQNGSNFVGQIGNYGTKRVAAFYQRSRRAIWFYHLDRCVRQLLGLRRHWLWLY